MCSPEGIVTSSSSDVTHAHTEKPSCCRGWRNWPLGQRPAQSRCPLVFVCLLCCFLVDWEVGDLCKSTGSRKQWLGVRCKGGLHNALMLRSGLVDSRPILPGRGFGVEECLLVGRLVMGNRRGLSGQLRTLKRVSRSPSELSWPPLVSLLVGIGFCTSVVFSRFIHLFIHSTVN